MKLPIYIYGHPVLRKKCKIIDSSYPDLDNLITNMFDTMSGARGVGLAAPQVGLAIKLFLIDIHFIDEENNDEVFKFKRICINPEIIEKKETLQVRESEGCLSIPSLTGDVNRSNYIKVTYLDQNFKKCTEVLRGFSARVFQHEYDHLKGVLFIDYLSNEKRKMMKKKLKNIEKGKFEQLYPIVLKK
ncbi:MAG: peptide deformylase [Flavobacteriales bacterium]|jgi:peptide deformylase|nr:peptide deformylase [Flavobacteriales bacterium]|tara:strand:+ start:325 stop:885 length:561 start_codon:yes stop_codon:yes gene_type:complete